MSTIRLKISSEGAGTIAITPVVVQHVTLDELVSRIASVCGKDAGRIRELLRTGSVVNGNSRLRWDPGALDAEEFDAAIRRLPDPDPDRPFSAERCAHIVLRSPTGSLPLTREAGSKRRIFRRSSFWDTLLTELRAPRYLSYSYAERADVYRASAAGNAVKQAEPLLAYRALAARIRALAIEEVDLYCYRQ